MEYITSHLIELLFTIISAICLFLYGKIKKTINTIAYNKATLLVITKDLFVQKYYLYTKIGSISLLEKESLNSLYQEYKKLGGNGVVDDLYQKINTLPLIKEEDNH